MATIIRSKSLNELHRGRWGRSVELALWRLAACFRKDMPHPINLIFSNLLLVAAGTERSLSGVDVRIRGASHRCIGTNWRKPKTRSVGWSPNYIREEHVW